ncbi:unnamed protein product [Lasius platythorax]|uniref:Uncharacterized protein n=1 Tax=Lasius platythorax TaxID=488582 RepID=A0AAV2NCL3_9HYME
MRRGESSAIYSDNFCSRTICTCCTTMAATTVSDDVGDCRRPVQCAASRLVPVATTERETRSGKLNTKTEKSRA